MRGKVFYAGTAAFAAAAILAGLATVGGPGQARKDRFDSMRLADLTRISGILMCREARDRTIFVLPMELDGAQLTEHCDNRTITPNELHDDETGEPYVYKRHSDTAFSVCATFHDAERATFATWPSRRQHAAFDPSTGCVKGDALR